MKDSTFCGMIRYARVRDLFVRFVSATQIMACCYKRVCFQCFDLLREEQPDFADKLHPIAGDLLEPDLAISTEDQTFLQENIDIVVHSAASIKFDDPLRYVLVLTTIAEHYTMVVRICCF